ncbi:MAG TPA: hypothetical protein VKR31_05305 [Rhizomicrobium sp.]|nr:hypothetical protein [Rhizomicrobium sp.]
MERIVYARRQALDAYQRANECMDNHERDEWLKAATLWEALARQYEVLLNVTVPASATEGLTPTSNCPKS